MALCPWDVLGSGKCRTREQLEERRKTSESLRSFFGEKQTRDEARASAILEEVANEINADSIQAVTSMYVMMQKARYVFPMIGGRKVEHLDDNIKALSLHLSHEQSLKLDSIKEFDLGFPMTFVRNDPHENGGKQNCPLESTAKMTWHQHGKPIGHD